MFVESNYISGVVHETRWRQLEKVSENKKIAHRPSSIHGHKKYDKHNPAYGSQQDEQQPHSAYDYQRANRDDREFAGGNVPIWCSSVRIEKV